jgi:hypothetical protein
MMYRPATSQEVHAASFGAIRLVRASAVAGWSELRGTLDDEAVFGPKVDYRCVCGKYRGPEQKGAICDTCGVKVTSSESRRSRFGHIDLPNQVRHPLGEPSTRLEAFPVLPAAIRERDIGGDLNQNYEDVLRALSPWNTNAVEQKLERIIQVVLPILAYCVATNREEASVYALGAGLVPRSGPQNGRCSECGFTLEGLQVTECPGCGKKREPG